MKNSEFYTLNGYKIKNHNPITESMEDYIEMIYREKKDKEISIKELSTLLNVTPASTSKMVNKLKELEIVNFEKYKTISLTNKGIKLGKYFLWRHKTLEDFFRDLNKDKYYLEQIEKIEHFIDKTTLINMHKKNSS